LIVTGCELETTNFLRLGNIALVKNRLAEPFPCKEFVAALQGRNPFRQQMAQRLNELLKIIKDPM
jgi:hypothetical protein